MSADGEYPPEVQMRLAELAAKHGLSQGAAVMDAPATRQTAAELVPEPMPKRRPGGRPKAATDAIPWDEIRHAYCYGEAVVDDLGTPAHRYASLAELERRFGVTSQSIRARSLRDGWDDTRLSASRQIQADTTQAVVAQVSAEKANQVRQQVIGALGGALTKWADDVAEGTFKLRSMKDVEIAVGVLNRLGAEQEAGDLDAEVTLDAISRRRREIAEEDAAMSGLGEADAQGIPRMVIALEPDDEGTYAPPARHPGRKHSPPVGADNDDEGESDG